MKQRKLQIGVMGSCTDIIHSQKLLELGEEVGWWIAKKKAILLVGAEKDVDSVSQAACRGAKKAKGQVVGVTYGKGLDVHEKNIDIIIATGSERGGGREFVLVNSCDVIITINGGSGTLTEIAIAYQANIPIIALGRSGGWSEKLANTFLDERKRIKIISAESAKEAVNKAIDQVKNSR